MQNYNECLVAIEIQKSSYGKQFYVGIKVYIDKICGVAIRSDSAILTTPPTLYRRQPKELEPAFDLTNPIDDQQRTASLPKFFVFLEGFAAKAQSRSGILELEKAGLIFMVPGLREDIERLNAEV